MDTGAIAAMSMGAAATSLAAEVSTSTQRSALDAVEGQMAILLQSISIPAGLTFSPDGPAPAVQRNFVANL